MVAKYKTPGVYITEVNAFPNSVVPVATAVPAFIGYTPQAECEGKSYLNIPTKISSFSEFEAIFLFPQDPKSRVKPKQYFPQYYISESASEPMVGDYVAFGKTYYSIVPDPSTIYYFYSSIRLFFENGGGEAYIVSVGTYGKPSGKPLSFIEPLVNPNVKLNELLQGLELLKEEQEPTIYICPEATLLSLPNYQMLTQEMLLQSSIMGTAISILDVPGGRNPTQLNYGQGIEDFRNSTGMNGLSYGAAYYPFVATTILQPDDLDYTNLFGGDTVQLAKLVNPGAKDPQLNTLFDEMKEPVDSNLTTDQYNNALTVSSALYKVLMSEIRDISNLLPPSGGMAGVISMIDNQEGVWKAPANVSINGVKDLPIKLNESQQSGLNVDAMTGKSVNAIRVFPGMGVMVWGARTLDGNSLDYRYIPVRRTLIYIEQSCKLAAQAFVFEPNDQNTWTAVKSMISSFLASLWKEGGLAGARPEDAFSVDCGLGTTMTSNDILDGIMAFTIKVAITHPAEFIVITFQQQMAESA